MKIALFTPWQPQRTGVAEYSRVLLPSLLELAEVDLWLSHTPAAEAAPCPIVDYRAAPQRLADLAGYDAVIYQMGNSPVHQPVLEVMLNHPGVVVMHDYVLHHLLAGYHLERLHDPDGYLREVRYNCGPAGEAMARAALAGQRPPLWEDPLIPALNYRVLDHTQGVIVHSAYARRLITDSHPHLPVVKLELPVPEAQIPDRTALKLRHGLPSERPVVAVFGFPSRAKRVEIIMSALAALDTSVTFLMVGAIGDGWDERLRRMNRRHRTVATGYVDDATFEDYCRLTDICLDLRYPTMGESSATCCRVMGAGGVCVVSDLGWYSELPAECVVRIAPGPEAGAVLLKRLTALLGEPGLRERIGDAAMAYIGQHHRPAATAAGYVAFIRWVAELRARDATRAAVLDTLGAALAASGFEGLEHGAIHELARGLAGLGLKD